jgi:hypothetical protein
MSLMYISLLVHSIEQSTFFLSSMSALSSDIRQLGRGQTETSHRQNRRRAQSARCDPRAADSARRGCGSKTRLLGMSVVVSRCVPCSHWVTYGLRPAGRTRDSGGGGSEARRRQCILWRDGREAQTAAVTQAYTGHSLLISWTAQERNMERRG